MIYIILAIILFFVDYIIKRTVEKKLKEGELHTYCKGKIGIQKIYNKGAAMGRLQNRPKLLRRITIGAIVVFLWVAKDVLKTGNVVEKIGFSLALGGGAGNAYDRIAKKKVTDYIRFPKVKGKVREIVFNAADFFLIIGGSILCFAQFFKKN